MLETYINIVYRRIFVSPVVRVIENKITPNQITILSGIVGCLILPTLFFEFKIVAIILLLFSGYLDTLDGALARFTHCTSDWGTVLDITTDRFVEFVVLLALWSVSPQERGFCIILMLGSILLCITSFLVVGIFTANDSDKGFHYSPGIMERAEAFLFFISMILWPSAFAVLAFMFSFLVMLTAIIRLKQFYCITHLGYHLT
jgi:phosphatidylglycerophosphate synthase